MPDNPLKQLGKYQLSDVLGAGAMGVVYRAFDPVLNRFLAIKVMSAVIASDESLRDRFLREARAAGSLQHPNVITVFDFGDVDGHLFIAMEFVEGVDLAELIERRDPMPIVSKLEIIIDTLNGLAYAHNRGLVHRDIKPANIRVTPDGRAKLMDFGIARLQSSEMTRSGEMLGTPQYMAPEQVTGGEITPAADIFAVGAVLYEFLTYAKAFAGDTLHVIMYNIASTQPPSVRSLVSGMPPSIESIVERALAKDPADRYKNAPAMVAALTNAKQELSGGGGRSTTRIRPSSRTLVFVPTPWRKKTWQRAIAGGTLMIGVAGASWFGASRMRAPVAPSSVPAPKEESPPAAPAPTQAVARGAKANAPATPAPEQSRPGRGGVPNASPSPAATTTVDAAPQSTVARAPVSQSLSAPVAPVTTSPAVTAPPASTPTPSVAAPLARVESTPKAPTDPRPEIERVVGLYARAIESTNIAEIKRSYPGLTAQQQQAWEGFFKSVKNFKAHLTVDRLDVTGTNANAAISAVYEYDNKTSGDSERRALRFQATLSGDAGGWRIVTVR